MTKIPIVQVQSIKGGVGKTTTVINLAHGLTRKGFRVLAVDLDAQSNLTKGFGFEANNDEASISDVLRGKVSWRDARATVRENLEIIPSTKELIRTELAMNGYQAREITLRKCFKDLDGYDFVLLDCPPNMLTMHHNALLCATHLLVPIQIGVWSIKGVQDIFDSVNEVYENFNYKPAILGAFLTMVDLRRNLTREIKELTEASFAPEQILPPIHVNADLGDAPKLCETIFEYNANSRGAADYEKLTDAVLNRLQKGREAIANA